MMRLHLRTKILISVGIIIFLVLGTTTVIYIQDLKKDYLEALEWRSEALAQGLVHLIVKRYNLIYIHTGNIQKLVTGLSTQCKELYDLHKEKNVAYVSVIDESGVMISHSDDELLNGQIESSELRAQLDNRQQSTILDGATYHTLIPVFGVNDTYLCTIDIGVPRAIVDQKVRQVLFRAVVLFCLFLLVAIFTISLLMHFLITKPVRRLVTIGQQLAEGHFVFTPQTTKRGDEIVMLGAAFNHISTYLQNVAGVASNIANGVLSGELSIRSKHDVLGKAIHDMVDYLRSTASVMTKIAEGDLTERIQERSTSDAFGRSMHAMTEGLHALIKQIRTSAEQITTTGGVISSLANREAEIVEGVNASVEDVVSTMSVMGASVEEVVQSMETLSSSVEETTSSVVQMTSTITHVASNTNDLAHQIHQTIKFLDDTVNSLERVVEKSTGVSKQLSQETIQDALEGQEAVEQVMSSMETLQNTISTAVDSITRFAQQSQEIGTVLDVIGEITDQTSLLALNASIISAQAGEHGKGFAVVADEIKSLAAGVGNSTKDIAVIVKNLQQETTRVVQTIHEGAENVENGLGRTQQARETLQKIISSAQRSSSVVTEIADALHELMATSRNVATAMERVNKMTDDITAATNEQKTGTEHIRRAISDINEMASQIRKATLQQATGIQRVIDVTNGVIMLITQNLESAQKVAATTEEFASQADILLQAVDRFKLN